MADKSARFLSFMLATFKKLGTALARRKIKQYVDLSKNFISKFRAYDTLFRKFYNDNIVPLKQQHEAIIEEQRKSEEAKAKAIEDATAKRMQEVQRQEKFQESGKQQFLESAINAPQTSIPSVTPTENMPIPLSKQKAANFIVSLEKIALLNNPNQLVSQILAFSAELEDSNPDMSLKLIAIVEGIVNEYQIG
jgi:deoxyribodipyrimidine photolyase